MTCFRNPEICFQHSQCVVSKQHVGLYVESKLHGYVDLIFCLFLFDQTARIDPTGVWACRGSFGVFETTCFQLDWAARIKTTGIPTLALTDLPPIIFGVQYRRLTPSPNLTCRVQIQV